MSRQLEFATSLVSLALCRNHYQVHKEPRGDEVLLHVYEQERDATSEASFFVRVQAQPTVDSAKAFRESDPQPLMYGKPTYLAQLVDDKDTVVASSGLEQKMRYTAADFVSIVLA